ncbi:hypothetical protein pb186bvf_007781 [Paramecium bursaria]
MLKQKCHLSNLEIFFAQMLRTLFCYQYQTCYFNIQDQYINFFIIIKYIEANNYNFNKEFKIFHFIGRSQYEILNSIPKNINQSADSQKKIQQYFQKLELQNQMFKFLRDIITKTKNYFFQTQEEAMADQLSSVNELTEKFEALKLNLDVQQIDGLDNEEEKIPKDEVDSQDLYNQIVTTTLISLTQKQSQYYQQIDFLSFQNIRKALKTNQYQRLNQGQWLNDEIINGYLKHLDKNQETIIFNTYHFDLLLKANDNSFQRIIKKAQVNDSTKYIIIPYNQSNIHWYTITIDLEMKEISIYDSLTKVCYMTKDQAEEIAKRIKLQDYNFSIRKCPQQDNGYDCGVFTIKNISILAKYKNENLMNCYDQELIFYDRLIICNELLKHT